MKKKRKPSKSEKAIWIALTIFGLCFLSMVVFALGTGDNHRTNFRYLTYKFGRSPSDFKWCLHLTMVDAGLNESMKGKSIGQLRSWFPLTSIPKPGTWQKDWLESRLPGKGRTYQVIGDSHIALQFVDGKFDCLLPMKG